MDELENDLDCSGCGLIEVISHHLPGRLEENHEKPLRALAGVTTEIGT
jgi:hypothetical protein